MEKRTCKKCGKTKDISFFRFYKKTGKLAETCKECQKTIKTKEYKRNYMLKYNSLEKVKKANSLAQSKFHKSTKGQIKSLKQRLKKAKKPETILKLQNKLIELLSK